MTSRMTSAQIIAQGEYLETDFDPSTLTVAQLLGVFGFHNVNYPTTYTKPKLITVFNDEIKHRAKKFRKERLSRQNSQASEDGITDGYTGKPLSESKPAAPVRRSSRRSSRAHSQDSDREIPKAEPPKRRRSSAEPSLGGPSRRRTVKPSEPVVQEESEPEEVVVRKVSRNKKSSADAGTQARRLALDDQDSGWEDNNIFQSGAESSSPVRPSPVRPRTRRPTIMSTRSRKSMSAPPEYAQSPTKGKETAQPAPHRAPSARPPESNFEPDLPAEVTRETKPTLTKSQRSSVVPEALKDIRPRQSEVKTIQEEEEEEEPQEHGLEPSASPLAETAEGEIDVEGDIPLEVPDIYGQDDGIFEELSDEGTVLAVSRRIAEGGKLVYTQTPPNMPSLFSFYRAVLLMLTAISFYLVYDYKHESALIGFCETGKTTNDVLQGLQARLAAIDNCNKQNRTYLYSPNPDTTESVDKPTPSAAPSLTSDTWAFGDEELRNKELCPAPQLLPLPHPNACMPCPAHAVCTPMSMICETGHLIRPHRLLFFLPLPTSPSRVIPNAPNSYTVPSYSSSMSASESPGELIYKGLSQILDGLPGLGPVALPPRCIEDPKRKERVGALGNAIESVLAAHRGRVLCAGDGLDEPAGTESEEAKKWGLYIDELKENMKTSGMKKKLAPHLLETFEDNFNEAIQQLLQWGGVFIGEDDSGKRYIAHKSSRMDWTCATKVKARESWKALRMQILGSVCLVMMTVALRRRRAQNVVESQRVAQLVQTALESLRTQELAHHTDPVTAPHPFLSSLQLRDLILQDEHSVGARHRLWERVERVVESNANVRTNLEEMAGGDEMRVWRWVGSAGKTLSPSAGGVERQAISSDDHA